jgi:hypothetical protein
MKPADDDEYEKAEDKDGNKLKVGDTCDMEYRVSGGKHRRSYTTTR